MQSYGRDRRDNLTCCMGRRDQGCCIQHNVAKKFTLGRKGPRDDRLDRAAARRARAAGKREAREEASGHG